MKNTLKNGTYVLLFQLEKIDIELNYIKELYELAEEFEIPVAERDIDNYDVNYIFITIVIIFQKNSIIFTYRNL